MKFHLSPVDMRDMSDLDRLVCIMEAEGRSYAELEELEEKKRDHLVAGDVFYLEDLLRRQESVVSACRKLEARRQEFMQKWHKNWGQEPNPTLREIINRAPSESAELLQRLKGALICRAETLSHHVRGNEILVSQSLEHVKRLVGILTGTHEPLAYKRGGHGDSLGRRRLISRSV